MTKIKPDHLARDAIVYVRNRPPFKSRKTSKASDDNMAWLTARVSSAGLTPK